MAVGSGRAAILRLRLNRGRKTRPKSWLTSFPASHGSKMAAVEMTSGGCPASPSWIQDGGGGNDVWRMSRRP